MKTEEIRIGTTYIVRVSGKLVPVLIKGQNTRKYHVNGRARPVTFLGINTATNRAITITAAKCRREYNPEGTAQKMDRVREIESKYSTEQGATEKESLKTLTLSQATKDLPSYYVFIDGEKKGVIVHLGNGWAFCRPTEDNCNIQEVFTVPTMALALERLCSLYNATLSNVDALDEESLKTRYITDIISELGLDDMENVMSGDLDHNEQLLTCPADSNCGKDMVRVLEKTAALYREITIMAPDYQISQGRAILKACWFMLEVLYFG